MHKAISLSLALCCLLYGASVRGPILRVLLTSGWNEKPGAEFIVLPDRTFVWHSADVERKGKIEKAALDKLLAHIETAQPGPPANDAGMLQVNWLATSGKMAAKVFYFPAAMPASGLVHEIEEVSIRYSEPAKAQAHDKY